MSLTCFAPTTSLPARRAPSIACTSPRRPRFVAPTSHAAANGASASNGASNGAANGAPPGNGASAPSPFTAPFTAAGGADNGIAAAIDNVGAVHPSWGLYNNDDDCVVCEGLGHTVCSFCMGDKVVVIGPNKERDTITCPHCDGTGVEECPRCEGTGKRPATRWNVLGDCEEPNPTNAEVRRPKEPAVTM